MIWLEFEAFTGVKVLSLGEPTGLLIVRPLGGGKWGSRLSAKMVRQSNEPVPHPNLRGVTRSLSLGCVAAIRVLPLVAIMLLDEPPLRRDREVGNVRDA